MLDFQSELLSLEFLISYKANFARQLSVIVVNLCQYLVIRIAAMMVKGNSPVFPNTQREGQFLLAPRISFRNFRCIFSEFMFIE